MKIKNSLKVLNQKFVEILHSLSIPATGILIDNYYDAQNQLVDVGKLLELISDAYVNNILPVLYGDLLELPNGNFKVISSDLIVCNLVKIIKPKSTIFLSDVDGVFFTSKSSKDGIQYLSNELNATNINQLYKSPKDNYDVSGGMRKKAEMALNISQYSDDCFIGNGKTPRLLYNLFKGRKVKGTYVK